MANHKILVILALTSQESCDTVASQTSFLFSVRVIHKKFVGSMRKNAAAHRRGGRGRHMAYHASNGSVISTPSPSRWVPGQWRTPICGRSGLAAAGAQHQQCQYDKKGSELFHAGTSCLSDISPLYRTAAVLTTKKRPVSASRCGTPSPTDGSPRSAVGRDPCVPPRNARYPSGRTGSLAPTDVPRKGGKKENSTRKASAVFWWGMVDSNHRRRCQQIYSLSPLATREIPHIQYGIGAGGRIRTPDLLITNQLLYQLSYTSISPANRIITEVF